MALEFIDTLKAARDDAVSGRLHAFPIPELPRWPRMLIELRSISITELQKVQRAGRTNDEAAAQLIARMADGTRGLIVDDPVLGEISVGRWMVETCAPEDRPQVEALVGPDLDAPTPPWRLAELFGLQDECRTAADVIRWLVPPDNDVSLQVFAEGVTLWLRRVDAEESTRLLGE